MRWFKFLLHFCFGVLLFFLVFILPFASIIWYFRNNLHTLVLILIMVVQLYILAFQAELSLRNEALTRLNYYPVFNVIPRKGIVNQRADNTIDFMLHIGENPYGGILLKNVGKFPALNVLVEVAGDGIKSQQTIKDVMPPNSEVLVYKFDPPLVTR